MNLVHFVEIGMEFAQDKYRNMLDYIRNEVKDCDYIIVGD